MFKGKNADIICEVILKSDKMENIFMGDMWL